jgi:hypothetical protein
MLCTGRRSATVWGFIPWQVLFVGVGIALFIVGCGVSREQTEAAGQFSKSAVALADTVKTAYTQAPQDDADFRAARYLIFDGNYEKAKSGGITTLTGRLAAATVLAAYGQALSTLLDAKTQASDVSSATTKLAAAVKGLPQSVLAETSITGSDVDGAGNILAIAIDFYLDFRRRQTLEQIVPAMEPIVTKLCAKFGDDFDINRDGFFAAVYYSRADRILRQASRVSSIGELEQRSHLQPTLQRVDAIRTKAIIAFSGVKQAANSCVKSSYTLKYAITNPSMSFDDILDFANKAETAYNAVHAAVVAQR